MLCSKHLCLYVKQYQTHCRPGQIGWQLRRDGIANSNQAKMLGLNQTDNVPLREQAYSNRSIFKPLLQKAAISDTYQQPRQHLRQQFNRDSIVAGCSSTSLPSLVLGKEQWRDFNEYWSQKTQSKATSTQCIHQMEQQ